MLNNQPSCQWVDASTLSNVELLHLLTGQDDILHTHLAVKNTLEGYILSINQDDVYLFGVSKLANDEIIVEDTINTTEKPYEVFKFIKRVNGYTNTTFIAVPIDSILLITLSPDQERIYLLNQFQYSIAIRYSQTAGIEEQKYNLVEVKFTEDTMSFFSKLIKHKIIVTINLPVEYHSLPAELRPNDFDIDYYQEYVEDLPDIKDLPTTWSTLSREDQVQQISSVLSSSKFQEQLSILYHALQDGLIVVK